MSRLFTQRCFNHADREAAARCPSCGQCYCRECISEHEGRLLCAACLRSRGELQLAQHHFFARLARGVQLGVAFFVAWLFFYGAGQLLLKIPTSFHDASVWRSELFEQE